MVRGPLVRPTDAPSSAHLTDGPAVSRELLLLQSRPETVWSQKAATPAAQPVDNPLAHVMSIFGGRR